MTECREEHYFIRHHQAGADGKLRIAPLFDFMQDAAALHADELGCGLDFLHRNRMLWVLSRIRVAIDRMPEIGETIHVLTYPTGTERLFALRQFTITDADGGPLARATSCWLVLKAETYHPLRPESALERPLPLNEALPRHFSGLAKLPEVTEPAAPRQEVAVRPSLIDVNRHLNNARYAAFASDVAAELAPGRRIAEIELHFQHAALSGDRIASGGQWETPQTLLIDGLSPDGAVCYYQARVALA